MNHFPPLQAVARIVSKRQVALGLQAVQLVSIRATYCTTGGNGN